MGHERGTKRFDFCADPVKDKDCDCGNNYVAVCDPGWSSGYEYQQLVRRQAKNGGAYTYAEGYEAHHIVCVSSVMSKLMGSRDSNIRRVIRETVWCINEGAGEDGNMLAMPLFGHTVKHYCQVSADFSRYAPVSKKPPEFQNIPQHDWDHDGQDAYLEEIDGRVGAIAADIKKTKHNFKGPKLQKDLVAISNDFRTNLNTRGSTRNGGTHLSWLEARQDESSTNWCLPFSMARTAFVSTRGFPEIRDEWIDRMQNALKGG
jgi:hypothetical protein